MPVTIKKKGPGLAALKADLARVQSSDVLVGIPASATVRQSGPINNASLLFIHTHGSEINNIPARPVLEPAIEKNKAIISVPLGKAAEQIMQHHPEAARRYLEQAGTIAANSAKRYFTDPENGWAPNAPETIRRKGSARPLIDTAQMRRSITFVVRESGSAMENKKGWSQPEELPESKPTAGASAEEAATIGGSAESGLAEVVEGGELLL